eukprot:sb/3461504/
MPDPDLSSQLLSLLARMPNLQELSCSFFSISTRRCLPEIMQMCPKIQNLDLLDMCLSFDDPGIDAYRLMSRVRNLKIFANGRNIRHLSFCKSLTSLTLYNYDILDSEIAFIISHLKNLKILELYCCKKLTGKFLELLTVDERCTPKLEILLYISEKITVDPVKMSKTDDETTEPLNKRPRLNKSPFHCVSDEVLLFIFRYLDSPDLLNCRAVSRTWSELSNVLLRSRKSRITSSVESQYESEQNTPRFADFTKERMVEGEPSLHQLPDEVILQIFTEKLGQLNNLIPFQTFDTYNLSRDALRSKLITERRCPILPKKKTSSGADDNLILFTCDGCGISGSGRLDPGYRLVKTAMMVEVGTQTGVPEIRGGSPTTLGSEVGCLEDEIAVDSVKIESLDPFYYDSVADISAAPPMGDVSFEKDSDIFGLDGEEHCSKSPTLPPSHQQQKILPQLSLKSTPRATKPFVDKKETISSYQCKVKDCLVWKPSEKELYQHIRVDHPDRKHFCDVCPMAFVTVSHLNQHLLSHSGYKPHKCKECGKSFSTKSHLHRHQTIGHSNNVMCRLKNCGVKVPRSELYKHIETVHPRNKFQCEICPMSFKKINILNIYLDSPDLLNCRAVSRTWSELSNVLLRSRKSRITSSVESQYESEQNTPRFADFTKERMVEGEPSLHQLPDEVILHIFTFFDPVELLEYGKVCKLWYNLSRDALRSVHAIVFSNEHCLELYYDNYCEKSIYCPEERIAEPLNTFKGIVDKVECDISMKTLTALNKLPNLKSLGLLCETMSIAFAHAAAVYLPRAIQCLSFMNFWNQHGVEDRVCEIISNQPFLHKLVLEEANFISVEKFASTLKKLPLCELTLGFSTVKSSVHEEQYLVKLNNIVSSLPETLERLIITGPFLFDPIPLPYFNNLTYFEIFQCSLDEESLESLLSRMPVLKEFKFTQCLEITGKSIVSSLEGNSVERISITKSCSKLENQTLLEILLAFSTTLENLTLPSKFLLSRNLRELPVFPKLKHLSLVENIEMTPNPDLSKHSRFCWRFKYSDFHDEMSA